MWRQTITQTEQHPSDYLTYSFNLFCKFNLFVPSIQTHFTSYEPCRLINLCFLVWITCHLSPVRNKTLKHWRCARIFNAAPAPATVHEAPAGELNRPKPGNSLRITNPTRLRADSSRCISHTGTTPGDWWVLVVAQFHSLVCLYTRPCFVPLTFCIHILYSKTEYYMGLFTRSCFGPLNFCIHILHSITECYMDSHEFKPHA